MMAERVDKSVHQARFLAAFAESASIGVACKWARVSRNAHYKWLEEDPEYPAKFERAQVRAARIYHDEAVRRAVKGIRKAVRYKGKVVTWDIEYSDTLLLALLKAHMPDKFRDREPAIQPPSSNYVDLRHSILAAVADLPEDIRLILARRLIEGKESATYHDVNGTSSTPESRNGNGNG